MVVKLPHSQTKLDDRELQVRFSPSVREAFHTLADIASKSEHFDQDAYDILREWGEGKPASVHHVIISFAQIARDVAEHISQTKDERAKDAWDELCLQLPEQGFAVSHLRRKGPQPPELTR